VLAHEALQFTDHLGRMTSRHIGGDSLLHGPNAEL
jgi:hypothetical protein